MRKLPTAYKQIEFKFQDFCVVESEATCSVVEAGGYRLFARTSATANFFEALMGRHASTLTVSPTCTVFVSS